MQLHTSIKHGVDEIVDAYMNICTACTMRYICNRHYFLLRGQNKV